MSTQVKIIGLVVIILLTWFVAVPIAQWKISRWKNYTFDYRSQVEETVRDMVKPECLKE